MQYLIKITRGAWLRPLAISLAISLVSTHSWGQKKIVFDFEEKKITKNELEDIKVGDMYQLQIKNINLNTYKISLSNTDTNLPEAVELPMPADLDLGSLANLFGNSANLVAKAIKGLDTSQLVDDNTNSQKGNRQDPSVPFDSVTLLKKLIKHKTALQRHRDKLLDIQTNLISIKLNWFTHGLYALDPIEPIQPGQTLQIKGEVVKITNTLDDLVSLKKRVENHKKGLTLTIIDNKELLDANPTLDSSAQKIKKAYQKLTTNLDTALRKLNREELLGSLKDLYFLTNNSQIFSSGYKSMPMQYKGGRLKITYSIAPRNDEYLLNSYSSELVFPLQSKLIIGVGASFFGSGLKNSRFSSLETVINDSVSQFSLVKENENAIELGVASMLHIGHRFNNAVGLGLSFGPGITMARNPQFRFLTGGGVYFGRKHNFSLQGGLILGPTEKLSAAYSLEESYKAKPESFANSSITSSWFISLGYFFQK